MQRARVEEFRTVEWQKEELAKMEEELGSQTERIRTDVKNAIERNLQQHQHVAMQQKHTLESETREYLFRNKQHLVEQADRNKRDMESKVAAATQKETLASQNEGLANDREVIAAQTAREKQVASDHLYSRQL